MTPVLLLLALVPPAAARDPAPEDAVKAAMLYNFVQFVRWPDVAEPPGQQELVIGMLGRDSLQELLLALAVDGKHSRSFAALQIGSLAELRAHKERLQVLYVGRTAQQELDAVLKVLEGEAVLTVSDDELFVRRGEMMNFVRYNSRIRFDLNLDAVANSGLKISSRLHGLARQIVKGGVTREGR